MHQYNELNSNRLLTKEELEWKERKQKTFNKTNTQQPLLQ